LLVIVNIKLINFGLLVNHMLANIYLI